MVGGGKGRREGKEAVEEGNGGVGRREGGWDQQYCRIYLPRQEVSKSVSV